MVLKKFGSLLNRNNSQKESTVSQQIGELQEEASLVSRGWNRIKKACTFKDAEAPK
jgi:hypothetical protein